MIKKKKKDLFWRGRRYGGLDFRLYSHGHHQSIMNVLEFYLFSPDYKKRSTGEESRKTHKPITQKNC